MVRPARMPEPIGKAIVEIKPVHPRTKISVLAQLPGEDLDAGAQVVGQELGEVDPDLGEFEAAARGLLDQVVVLGAADIALADEGVDLRRRQPRWQAQPGDDGGRRLRGRVGRRFRGSGRRRQGASGGCHRRWQLPRRGRERRPGGRDRRVGRGLGDRGGRRGRPGRDPAPLPCPREASQASAAAVDVRARRQARVGRRQQRQHGRHHLARNQTPSCDAPPKACVDTPHGDHTAPTPIRVNDGIRHVRFHRRSHRRSRDAPAGARPCRLAGDPPLAARTRNVDCGYGPGTTLVVAAALWSLAAAPRANNRIQCRSPFARRLP